MYVSPLAADLSKIPLVAMGTTTEPIPLENRPSIMATFISLYALIFFFGICGNALVIRKYKFLLHTKTDIAYLTQSSCCVS